MAVERYSDPMGRYWLVFQISDFIPDRKSAFSQCSVSCSGDAMTAGSKMSGDWIEHGQNSLCLFGRLGGIGYGMAASAEGLRQIHCHQLRSVLELSRKLLPKCQRPYLRKVKN